MVVAAAAAVVVLRVLVRFGSKAGIEAIALSKSRTVVAGAPMEVERRDYMWVAGSTAVANDDADDDDGACMAVCSGTS